MRSYVTTFVGVFEPRPEEDAPEVNRIEIPLIQRDYAQGRPDPATERIRDTFLDVLCDAITGAEPVGLDFVYGELEDGVLRPLDGQQRLTTLFLLHWYLAAATGHLDGDARWLQFSYATRPSARMFCERLAKVTLPDPMDREPSAWLRDQPWHLFLWRHDPTVKGMLVVIDAIHARLAAADLDAAWRRLVDPDRPAITFDFLPIEDMGAPEDLYIKMNSRGRPLTDFENFKARLLQVLEDAERVDELAANLDGPWSDLLWPRHGGDDVIDDEFLNYISFVIELCEWRRGDVEARGRPLIDRAAACFGIGQPDAEANLTLLFDAFGTWLSEDGEDLDAFFDHRFATTIELNEDGHSKLVIFGGEANSNLFEACLRDFGSERRFGSQRKLLLYAVLLHRIHGTSDFSDRLRVLRNLLAASEDELRAEAMAQIVGDVEQVILNGDLAGVVRLNQAQRGDEAEKQDFLSAHPELRPVVHALEDHDLLRGSLVAFELNPERLEDRAASFSALFADPDLTPSLTGALLATGQYQRKVGSAIKFGAPEPSNRWRDLLTGADRDKMAMTRTVMSSLLDALADAGPGLADRLAAIQDAWLQRQEAEGRFDWPYYLVRYPSMRSGKSGIYRSADGAMGYSVCMLQGEYLNGYYRDPFLYAVVQEADAANHVVGGDRDGPWFVGAASNERWLTLERSMVRIRSVPAGFEITSPEVDEHEATFDRLVVSRGDVDLVGDRYLVAIPQVELDGVHVDTVDRVELAAELLRQLCDEGA